MKGRVSAHVDRNSNPEVVMIPARKLREHAIYRFILPTKGVFVDHHAKPTGGTGIFNGGMFYAYYPHDQNHYGECLFTDGKQLFVVPDTIAVWDAKENWRGTSDLYFPQDKAPQPHGFIGEEVEA